MTPKTIRFTSQADELTVARDLVMNSNKNNRLAMQVVFFINLVNLGYGIFDIVGYRDTISLFGVSLICGLIIVPAILYRKRFVANEAKGGIAYEFTIDERGIEAVVPKSFSVAWKELHPFAISEQRSFSCDNSERRSSSRSAPSTTVARSSGISSKANSAGRAISCVVRVRRSRSLTRALDKNVRETFGGLAW